MRRDLLEDRPLGGEELHERPDVLAAAAGDAGPEHLELRIIDLDARQCLGRRAGGVVVGRGLNPRRPKEEVFVPARAVLGARETPPTG